MNVDGVGHLEDAKKPEGVASPILPATALGSAAARAATAQPDLTAVAGPAQFSLELEDDEALHDVDIGGMLAALGPAAEAAPASATGRPIPGAQTALVAVGIAAGVGVGVLVGGPMGCIVAGLAGAMGLARGLVSLQSENQRLKQELEALRQQASTDSLTHLPNRKAVFERLARNARRCAVDDVTVGIVMLDIDHFKHVNDTWGHPAGDAVLAEVAARLQASLRPGDAVGRYGGEEFLVVLPDSTLEQAAEAADRLRRAVARTPVRIPFAAVGVTISLGVATVDPSHPNVDARIAAADHALYRAKANGRNRVEIAAD